MQVGPEGINRVRFENLDEVLPEEHPARPLICSWSGWPVAGPTLGFSDWLKSGHRDTDAPCLEKTSVPR